MPWDLAMDPITGDFVSDSAGGWQRTEHGDTAVLHQLECHYDAWWGDPELGSLLHDRDRFTGGAAPVAAEVERALGVLVRDGKIADLEVSAVESRAGRVEVGTTYRLVESDQLVSGVLTPLGG